MEPSIDRAQALVLLVVVVALVVPAVKSMWNGPTYSPFNPLLTPDQRMMMGRMGALVFATFAICCVVALALKALGAI